MAATTTPGVGPGIRTAIANIDVRGLVDRLDRMGYEFSMCQSCDMPNGMFAFDLARLEDALQDMRDYWTYAQSVPIPDAPEAHGLFSVQLPDISDMRSPEDIENDDISKLMWHLATFRIELANCQSARFIHGFMGVPIGQPGDRQRVTDAIERLQNFVNYVKATQPSDRPESTPMNLPTGPGRLGT